MTDKPKIIRFTTPPFVASYPYLFTARKMEDQPNSKPTFSIRAIWRPKQFGDADKKLWVAINNEIVRVVLAHSWPKGVKFAKPEGATANERRIALEAQMLKKIPGVKFGLRSGEDEFPDDKAYGPGSMFANMRSPVTAPPGVVDLSKARIHPTEGNADEIYPGATCRATMTIFAYPGKTDFGGRGYSFGLGNVQKIKDGPRLDSRVAAEDDFDEEVDGAWLDEVTGEADADAETKAEEDFG